MNRKEISPLILLRNAFSRMYTFQLRIKNTYQRCVMFSCRGKEIIWVSVWYLKFLILTSSLLRRLWRHYLTVTVLKPFPQAVLPCGLSADLSDGVIIANYKAPYICLKTFLSCRVTMLLCHSRISYFFYRSVLFQSEARIRRATSDTEVQCIGIFKRTFSGKTYTSY